MVLSDILRDLERGANGNGAAYRDLQRGLGVKVSLTVDDGVYQCSIARVAPSVPSESEESTVANALALADGDERTRRTNVLGRDGKRYNISSATYTRTQGVG